MAAMSDARGGAPRLGVLHKLALGSGDHAMTLSLSVISFVYFAFLTDVVHLRPALAGLVLWSGRLLDAFTDPVMGRISDATRSRLGRRRPYFLFGALPFGLSFALLWFAPGFESQGARFAFCVATYALYDLTSTILSVPYVAILPEIVPGYTERNSVNAYRSALVLLATLLAGATFVPLAEFLGGGRPDYLAAGWVFAAWLVWPWFWVYSVVRERPDFQRPPEMGLAAGARALLRHRNYLRLAGLYVSGRIAMDLVSMMLLFYFTHWLGRRSDFAPAIAIFILAAVAFLPAWVWLAERHDKQRVFQWGCAWWGGFMLLLGGVTPEAPSRWLTFALVALAAGGYAVIEKMPWSMLGEVIDEDELACGERREGVYGGVLTWARKLAGATAVALGGLVLEWAGYRGNAESQPETARFAIRWLTTLGPASLLLLAIWFASGYSLGRERHSEIRRILEARTRAAQ
jgi:GPH family glycoside/pentoside/hexuronide:cation symporter